MHKFSAVRVSGGGGEIVQPSIPQTKLLLKVSYAYGFLEQQYMQQNTALYSLGYNSDRQEAL